MKTVVIEYGRWLKRKKTLSVPTKWEELSASQFRVCSNVCCSLMSDEAFLRGFFGLSRLMVSRLGKYEQYKLIDIAEFVSNPKAMIDRFFMSRIPGTLRFAPEKKLHNVDLEHFMFFDTFYFDYANNPSDERLQKFVCALYLPYEKKIRDVDFEASMKMLSRIDKGTLYAIFLNYTFIRKWLAKAFPYLFGFTEEDNRPSRKKLQDKKKPTKKGPDWVGILDAMVADDVIHYEEYKKIPCTVAFRTINRRIQNYNKNGRH